MSCRRLDSVARITVLREGRGNVVATEPQTAGSINPFVVSKGILKQRRYCLSLEKLYWRPDIGSSLTIINLQSTLVIFLIHMLENNKG